MRKLTWLVLSCLFFQTMGDINAVPSDSSSRDKAQPATSGDPVFRLQFEGDSPAPSGFSFTKGLEKQALRVKAGRSSQGGGLIPGNLQMDSSHDFSVQFWIRTFMDSGNSAVILSKKEFADKSLASQKKSGWVFYLSGGTWAWNMGSGDRRITYERDNGRLMPLNDGKWHQLAMTFNSAGSEVRLFYDGDNKVTYKVSDGNGFDFNSSSPITIGSGDLNEIPEFALLPEINAGAIKLQELVYAFNSLGLGRVKDSELEDLLVHPGELYDEHFGRSKGVEDSSKIPESTRKEELKVVEQIRAELKKNPYTVHQAPSFMQVAPLLRIYSLEDGRITINREEARRHTGMVKLSPPEFDMDNLSIWNRVLSPAEVAESYAEYFKPGIPALQDKLPSITAAVWNIFHGGKHFELEKDGWDSRKRIAEMLRQENADVVMMQETYSSGDFIAAELGYYFATTVDWDYLNQGSNISVLSRYPITDVFVPADAPFNNVGVKVAISESQEMYVMSNWYGMNLFPAVFSFHKERFDQSDAVPILFAGDFNAVPHTDGGKSPASRKMLESGFTDAFRSLYPDVEKHPGYSHRGGHRIDQLYYKGKGLENISTKVVSDWPEGFPSDHFLIISEFKLDY